MTDHFAREKTQKSTSQTEYSVANINAIVSFAQHWDEIC
jgi:hypothetical protein